MDLIKAGAEALGAAVGVLLPPGWLRSLLVDGIVAGAGGVLVFLPQIVILFFFILLLEESGYLPRAAFLLDRLMGGVGLSGRSFIPLPSRFACAIPGIMAARTIADPRERLVTIMIAPLMTCSARLPVYALLIGAFVPARPLPGGLQLQGLVLFGLYLAGIVGALGVAWLLKHLTARGQARVLMMELPAYHWPTLRNIAIGLRRRAPIEYSAAGMLGHALAGLFAPIGFNWQISIALVPGMAARAVAVSALGTVYALSATGADTASALSLLAWYVFAPQCLSTLATVRRETGGRTMPLLMAGYLFALAYAGAFAAYRVALALGAG